MTSTTSPTASPVSMEESVDTATRTPQEPTPSMVEFVEEQSRQSETVDNKKKGKITEFVESSFASLERRFFHIGSSSGASSDVEQNDEAKDSNSNGTANGKGNANNTNTSTTTEPKKTKTKEEQDEDDAYATFTYLAILTALYLPFLLFLWIRRNVFGTASLVRSLFLGHMLRFGVAFMLLPPSTTRSFVPDRIWNYGVRTANRLERLWNNKRVQAMIPSWIHFVLTLILGVQTDPMRSSMPGTSNGSLHHAGSSNSNGVWPPPALMGLGIFTLLAFVVHPDGLTWIMLGHMRDGIHSSITKSVEYGRQVVNGEMKLTPSEISGTLASIIIFVTIVNHILSNKNAEKRARASHSSQKEKTKHKGKKGKKGRGRHHHGHNVSQKGRIKGGNYRSTTKDMYEEGPSHSSATTTNVETETNTNASEKSPLPSPPPSSRSPSPPISIQDRARCMSDMEDTAVSSATSETLNVMQTPTGTSSTHGEKKKHVSTGGLNVNVNVRPRSRGERSTNVVSPKIMEYAEDDKSCSSSIATAHTNATFPQPISTSLDRAENVGGSSSRRKNRNRKGKRSQGQNNKTQQNATFVPVSSSPVTSREAKVKAERKPHRQAPSSPTNAAMTTYSKKSHTNSLDRKGQRNRSKQNNQEARKVGYGGNSPDIHTSSFRKGGVTTEMAKQNRERSFTAPEPTAHATMRDNNRSKQSLQVDDHYRVENINGASSKILSEAPVQMEAILPVDTLERRMISESIRMQKEQQQRVQLASQNYVFENPTAPFQRPMESLSNNNAIQSQSYLYSNERTNEGFRPGKLELATFLSRVGLVGSLCGSLLADLTDVSSLVLLTDADYDRYGIGYAKRSEIRRLLESRGLRQQAMMERSQKTIGWNTGGNAASLRPPPGLSVPAQDSVVGGQRITSPSVSCSHGGDQSLSFLSSGTVSTASNSNFSFSAGSSLNSLSMPLGMPQCNDSQLHGAIANVESATRKNISLPPISSLGHGIHHQDNVNGGVRDIYSPKVHNDEEIEADLQELGGQMAGSILDF